MEALTTSTSILPLPNSNLNFFLDGGKLSNQLDNHPFYDEGRQIDGNNRNIPPITNGVLMSCN